KELRIALRTPLGEVPEALDGRGLTLEDEGATLVYSYDTRAERTGITALLADLAAAGVGLKDISTRQSSLEEIFMGLLAEGASKGGAA
ncbi:MAG: multidrug ABC transporter ATP-binding protein, partial [Rhodobacteraceae bacterium]|nr:multidrug ABC transporter ATP-binding protein [Paracoccaceae bacterium]